MDFLDRLHKMVNEICPITGLTQFGYDPIIIHYDNDASEKQRIEARKFVDSFIYTPEMKKEDEDNAKIDRYKNDISVKAGFVQYKITNPNASFLDYLNFLEQLNV